MAYKPNDHYAQKARKENFAARSVYKLEEIDARFKVLKKNDFVLDLGASPGSWMQYASKKIGDDGFVFGIDLKPVEVNLKNTVTLVADLNELDVAQFFQTQSILRKMDVVLSDMAPNTTGSRFTDQARSFDLSMLALETAKKFLTQGGNFVCKIFDGEDAMTFRDEVKKYFQEVNTFRPKSTQQSSKEFFVVGKKFNPSRSQFQ